MLNKLKVFFVSLFNVLKGFLISNTAKRFYWQAGNGLVAGLVVYLTDIKWEYLLLIVPVLNGITKEINNQLSK
jgi:hypothetical protein